jgi:hypothetical protein
MKDTTVRRLTGGSGALVGLGSIASIPLYFIYRGTPPAWDVLTRNLVMILVLMALLIFLTGLRHLLRTGAPNLEWPAALVYATGLVYTAVVLVGVSLEGGNVIGQPGRAVDATTSGPLAWGAILIHGSIGRALTVVMLAAAGYAIRRGRLLPGWIGTAAYVITAVNLAFIPSLYFGPDEAAFYSALGWGNTALTASLVGYWVGAAGIALLRRS